MAASAAASLECSSTVPSLPPPRPKSPPKYPDLYGKRRELAKVQLLEREIGFLQEELKSIEGLHPASKCCKEVADFVLAKSDSMIPTNRKKHKSCRFWKWLCGSSCFNFSPICCCCHSECSVHVQMPNCCDCHCNPCKCCLCNCQSCFSCPKPELVCRCCPQPGCCKIPSCGKCCCKFKCPSCTDLCCCQWNCSWRKCPKVKCSSCCTKNCCNPFSFCC